MERLPVPLGKADLEKRARELASTMVRIGQLEEEKADTAAVCNEQLKELRETAAELAREVHTGVRELLVETDEIRNLEAGMMDTVRTDTGELVRSRPLTDEERQVTIEDLRERRRAAPPAEVVAAAAAMGVNEVVQIIATTPEAQRELDEVTRSDEPHEPVDVEAPEGPQPEAFEID